MQNKYMKRTNRYQQMYGKAKSNTNCVVKPILLSQFPVNRDMW